MNKCILLISTLGLSGLVSGCVGTGPNTQQGAVSGGTLGAIAGAIIGHNSPGGDALGGAILGGTAGAIAGGTLGNSVDHQQGTIYGYPDDARYRRVIAPPPSPAPYAEPVSAPPAPNAVWAPGYWMFDGQRYTWVGGSWQIPPPQAHAYIAAHWEFQGDRYVFVPSTWR